VNPIEILQRSEGKTLEYKRDLSLPGGLLKTLVAFANTAGGVLAIGIEEGPAAWSAFLTSWPLSRGSPASLPIQFAHVLFPI
jgi:hypothetical protein